MTLTSPLIFIRTFFLRFLTILLMLSIEMHLIDLIDTSLIQSSKTI